MSGLKSDFNTVKGFVKHPLQPIPGMLGLPTIATIDYQLAPIKPPSIIVGVVKPIVGGAFDIAKPVVGTITGAAGKVLDKGFGLVDRVADTGLNQLNNFGNLVSNPFVIIGGLIAAVVIIPPILGKIL